MRVLTLVLTLCLLSCTPQKEVDERADEQRPAIQRSVPGFEHIEGEVDERDELNRLRMGDLFIDITNIQGLNISAIIGRRVHVYGYRTFENDAVRGRQSVLVAYSLRTLD